MNVRMRDGDRSLDVDTAGETVPLDALVAHAERLWTALNATPREPSEQTDPPAGYGFALPAADLAQPRDATSTLDQPIRRPE